MIKAPCGSRCLCVSLEDAQITEDGSFSDKLGLSSKREAQPLGPWISNFQAHCSQEVFLVSSDSRRRMRGMAAPFGVSQ
jgi:hypothetical protein